MARATGSCKLTIDNIGFVIRPEKSAYKSYGDFIWKYKKHKDKKPEKEIFFDVNINFTGKIHEALNGVIDGVIFGTPEVSMETHYVKRTLNQNSTYYGILYFMFWIQAKRKPQSGETTPYNDALMEMYAPEITEENPLIEGEKITRLKRQTEMSTVEFARLIEGALAWLAGMEIPEEVHRVIGKDMKILWHNWYRWKNSEEGIIRQLEPDSMTYAQYKELHPVCELSGVGGTPGDPVVRMHLVANLQSTESYEQPWSYIVARQSFHQKQHNEGWEHLLKEFPHIKQKWENAQIIAKNKGHVLTEKKKQYWYFHPESESWFLEEDGFTGDNLAVQVCRANTGTKEELEKVKSFYDEQQGKSELDIF